jgi:transcription elongation GreA/GreB family factor
MRQKEELESALVRARGTDFANTRTDVAGIGTVVTATDLEANQTETFTVLGAWDFDADKGIISYLTPVGQSLMNRKVGEMVEFELHGARHRHRIDRIEAYKAPAPISENTSSSTNPVAESRPVGSA